ncbi:hypothetical protein ABGT22_10290 [Peribacillus frigoritolerans]|uniref:hypothetical protein n=1 Tax=Peribacillus frigoritolerans TaxID=450367 RepID=UPI00345DD0BC
MMKSRIVYISYSNYRECWNRTYKRETKKGVGSGREEFGTPFAEKLRNRKTEDELEEEPVALPIFLKKVPVIGT